MRGRAIEPERAENRLSRLLHDAVAGLTCAVANVPDAMANALLTGASPVRGLYSLMTGTPVAALTTSSEFLQVAVTAAMAIAIGETITKMPEPQRVPALVTVTVMIGAITVALGLLRAGRFVRFVPNAVMRGFLTGVAANVILAQIPALTGSQVEAPGRLARATRIVLQPGAMSLAAITLAALTVALVLVLERTPLERFAMTGALVAVSALSYVLASEVARVRDLGPIPGALPRLVLPDLRFVGVMLVPAISTAFIGLIQTAGVSRNTPNADGSYPDVSRDFAGQGLAGVVSGVFGGIPMGGSVSTTALNVQAGARSRWASFFVGPFIALIVVLFGRQVEAIPMAVLSALLILVGVRAIDVEAIMGVWHTGYEPAAVMAITFVGTLLIPIQYAVLLGVGITIVLQVYRQGAKATIVGLELREDGRLVEVPAPQHLASGSLVCLEAYGSLAFAGAQALEDALPDPTGAVGAVLVLRVRGQEGPGSTLIAVLQRYHARMTEARATLMLAGVQPRLREQLWRTGLLDELGRDNVFFATEVLTDATTQAIVEGRRRIDAFSDAHAVASPDGDDQGRDAR